MSADRSLPSGEITDPHVPTIHVERGNPDHPWFRWTCSCGADCGIRGWNNERVALKMYAVDHSYQTMTDEVAALRAEVEGYKNGNLDLHNENQTLRAERADLLRAHEETCGDYLRMKLERDEALHMFRESNAACGRMDEQVERMRPLAEAMVEDAFSQDYCERHPMYDEAKAYREATK